ncbi:LysR substrate-binding domain-containing protein [Ruegeria sp. 2205SS24-7]|uniref:LysR substrate-binding domain-containing protein n=1 Tax=Ruegeria discodermiae TaxID=3064389 RepID=UPI002741BD49|nr:LysR substrate-binding domain-containing protein [Ruegeria sp. 2205SS24-7]MDP5217098.1 LysR substrate-binding domain-containing protein [Ruegeria sp. 2205SS24-7]
MAQLPPLNALRAFDAAGRHLNFRAAADELGVTQGAVAQHVRQLEAQLGLPLFERLPKGVSFTPAGRGYHARIAAAFQELRAATEALRPTPGKVLISVTPSFAAKWLIPNLPDFAASHPDIDLQILATENVSRFHGDGIDLAVRQGEPPFGAALEAMRLFRQDIIAIAAPSLIAGSPLPLDPTVLADLPKLHDTHDLWPDYLQALGIEDQSGRGLRLSQTTLSIDAARAGQGIALVSRFLVAGELAAGQLVQIRPEVLSGKQNFYLLAARSKRRDPATQAVLDWFSSKAET